MPTPTDQLRLPNLVVIGAMKCGTSALHHYLDRHPDIAMAAAKEVNFFFGPEPPRNATGQDAAGQDAARQDVRPDWQRGQWPMGPQWYAAQVDPAAPVRGESSPGYTDPAHPEVAERMAALLPDARLVYLVRDPVERAVSQWRHHVRDGTEPRPVEEAVLDPDSQYLARSRYHERLAPFLARFDAAQVLVVAQERLLADRRRQMRRVYAHAGADPGWWDDALLGRVHVGADDVAITEALRGRVWEAVGDDVARLRALLGDDLPEWHRP